MKDYYLLVGLNSKEVKIININQKEPSLIEVVMENRKQKVRCPLHVTNLLVQYTTN